MKNLARFFSLVEMTKQVPRYGWTSMGFANEEIDTLAEHHFMVAIMTWLVGVDMEFRGLKFDVRRGVNMALGHDLGELFGGDVATPLGLVNPKIKQAARLIEAEAIHFLGQTLQDDFLCKEFLSLCKEEREQLTDEAKVVKMVDRLEAELYKEMRYRPVRYSQRNKAYCQQAILSITHSIKDPQIKKYSTQFANTMLRGIHDKELRGAPRERLTSPNSNKSAMRNLVDLCAVLEISKQVPRHGWGFSRFSQGEMDKISEHNYVLAVMNLFFGLALESKGLHIDTRKAVEMALIHDLSKLLGGDLPSPWRKSKPELDQAATEIKTATITLLGRISGNPKIEKTLINRYTEASEQKTDEAIIVRILTQLEDYLHREIIRRPMYTKQDASYVTSNIRPLVDGLTGEEKQRMVHGFIDEMIKSIQIGELRQSPLTFLSD